MLNDAKNFPHAFIIHLSILLGEVAEQVSALFLYWIICHFINEF